MRHAKSDWHSVSSRDHDRPLNDRGRAASHIMGIFLANISQVPDLVLVSSATRARTTVDLASAAGLWTCPIVVTPELYGESTDTIMGLVRDQDNAIHSLMLAGHEPTSSSMVGNFVGGGSLRFPTAALARVDFHVDRWDSVQTGTGELRWFVTPKILRGALEPSQEIK